MITPKDSRKSLEHKSRPWNWSDEEWREHCHKCEELMGFTPERPTKPDPDDEPMVMLSKYDFFAGVEVKYVRDMLPGDYERVNAWLPSVNQAKKIYGETK